MASDLRKRSRVQSLDLQAGREISLHEPENKIIGTPGIDYENDLRVRPVRPSRARSSKDGTSFSVEHVSVDRLTAR